MIAALRNHFLGPTQVERIVQFDHSQAVYYFECFSTDLQEAFTLLAEYDNEVPQVEQIRLDMFLSKIPIVPCYCQMMGRTLKEEIRITQYNNPTKAGKYSLEDLFRASAIFLTSTLSSKMT